MKELRDRLVAQYGLDKTHVASLLAQARVAYTPLQFISVIAELAAFIATERNWDKVELVDITQEIENGLNEEEREVFLRNVTPGGRA